MNTTIPQQIGAYTLQPGSYFKNPKSGYSFATYTRDGKKYLAKIWEGRKMSGAYHWLKNEVNTYQAVNAVRRDNAAEANRLFPDITVPELVEVIDRPGLLLVLFEMIEGQTINSFSAPEWQKVFDRARAYFAWVYKTAPHLNIVTRSPLKILSLSSYRLIINVRNDWMQSPTIFRAFFIVLVSLPTLIKNWKTTLVHQDLIPQNLMVKGDQIYILDLQYLVLSHPTLEFVSALSEILPNKEKHAGLVSSSQFQNILSNINERKILRALSAYIGLVDLSLGNRGSGNGRALIRAALSNTYE